MRTLLTLSLVLTSAASAQESSTLRGLAQLKEFSAGRAGSYDKTGGNADRLQLKPGESVTLAEIQGPGEINHMWFTIASGEAYHLKKLVLRLFWDGETTPSVEAPIGDFFGLGLGEYVDWQSLPMNVAPLRSLNSYWSMPFARSARITLTHEGSQNVSAFYYNFDYRLYRELPANLAYFHAQYRQAAPNVPTTNDWQTNGDANRLLNPDGKQNYVYCEARGRGHLMGVTLGILQNQEFWAGEGDDMIFIDDETTPAIIGTGSEDYFLGAWDFGGRDGALPFAHLYNGAPFMTAAERTGGRYCLYRWHGDNPVTFTRYLRHTMEHGHANHRADNFYSCCYWYQTEPHADFPALPPVDQRIPVIRKVPGPGGAI